eukprot:COSAG06_NODE_57174_length_281_cov_0.857143_1_plen_33_part_10
MKSHAGRATTIASAAAMSASTTARALRTPVMEY